MSDKNISSGISTSEVMVEIPSIPSVDGTIFSRVHIDKLISNTLIYLL